MGSAEADQARPAASAERLLIVEVEPEQFRERIAAACPELAIDTRRADDPDLAEAMARATLLLAWRFPAEAARHARHVKWVQSTGAGVDHLIRLTTLPPEVPITRVGRGFGALMAEYVAAYLLALAQRLPRALDQQRRREWKPFAPGLLRGRTALVIGLGAIGTEVAAMLRGLGLRVLGVSRTGTPSADVDEVWPANRLDEALPRAEIVVLTVPLTQQTERLFDARRLALVSRGTWLVNVSRGGVVDEQAVVEALESGRLGAAVLDVFLREPLPPESPLWGLRNVLVTPHIAGPYDVDTACQVFVENYRRWRAGQQLLYVVERARGY